MHIVKKIAIILAVIIVAVAAAAAYIYPDREYWRGQVGLGKKVAAKIDNQVIYLDDYNKAIDLVAKTYGGDKKHAKDYIPTIAHIAAAKQLKIGPSAPEISTERTKLFPDGGISYAWKTSAAFAAAIPAAIARQAQGSYAGAVVVFPYSQHFGVTASPPTGYKDAGRIADDKQYAQTVANQYHDKFIRAQLSDEKAVAQAKADARLVYAGGPNDSIVFGKGDKTWKDDLAGNNDLINYISTLGIGLDKIRTKQVKSAITNQLEDGALYFVDIKLAEAPRPTLQQDYNNLIKKQRVRVYVTQ